jgi:hypothetical protein
MDDFKKIQQSSTNYKTARDQKFKEDSRDRLSKILKKKIQTTMIGALSSIEENFSFLWNNDDVSENDKAIMQNLYQKVRSEILDKGNNQARNIDAELSQYDIQWLRYSVKIPMVKSKKED